MTVAPCRPLSKLPQPPCFLWRWFLLERNAPFDVNVNEIAIPGVIFGWRDITIGVEEGVSGFEGTQFQWK